MFQNRSKEKREAIEKNINERFKNFGGFGLGIMAKIVQSLTRASAEYEEDIAQSLVRDLDAVLEKLNTTFQEELKQEIEARSFFLD